MNRLLLKEHITANLNPKHLSRISLARKGRSCRVQWAVKREYVQREELNWNRERLVSRQCGGHMANTQLTTKHLPARACPKVSLILPWNLPTNLTQEVCNRSSAVFCPWVFPVYNAFVEEETFPLPPSANRRGTGWLMAKVAARQHNCSVTHFCVSYIETSVKLLLWPARSI